MAEVSAGPLYGVRVIELATVVAGPGVGKYLGDFGANVIKSGGAPVAIRRGRMGWTGPNETDSYFWKVLNRNKRTIALDLKSPEGRDTVWALLTNADILIENMRPGKLETLGFGPQDLLARNPKIVVLRVSGFGQDGPYALRPGFATIAEALSGLASHLGEVRRSATVAAHRADRRGDQPSWGRLRPWRRYATRKRTGEGQRGGRQPA